MKFLSVIFIAFISNVHASSMMTIKGDLTDRIQLKERINKVIITENNEELSLINEYNEVPSCERGEFEVVETEDGAFELTRIIKCESYIDQTNEVMMCPEVFMPVCGEVVDGNNKALPEIVSFSNMCDLYIAKASFVNFGQCD